MPFDIGLRVQRRAWMVLPWLDLPYQPELIFTMVLPWLTMVLPYLPWLCHGFAMALPWFYPLKGDRGLSEGLRI